MTGGGHLPAHPVYPEALLLPLPHEVECSEQVGQGRVAGIPAGQNVAGGHPAGEAPGLAGAPSSLLKITVLLIHNFDATGKVSW